MDTIECIRGRMSIRKFKNDTVPRGTIMKIIDIARYSPSYKNSQPWNVMVISGKKKKALSAMLVKLLESGTEPCPDLPAPETWPQPEADRIADLFRKRKEATGIDLAAPEMITKAKKANFRFYGAPHAIYLYQHSSLSQWSLFDIGLFAQSLMLAAHAEGLGTVPQAFATDYARDIKKFLGISKEMRLVLGISIGWPDMESPVNSQIQSQPALLNKSKQLVGILKKLKEQLAEAKKKPRQVVRKVVDKGDLIRAKAMQSEIRLLEDEARYLEERLNEIRRRLDELKK